jgi:hypothetical protein
VTMIHIASANQDGDIPTPPDRKPCARTDCPGEQGFHTGYGLAGGGMGIYTYCDVCEEILDKSQDVLREE